MVVRELIEKLNKMNPDLKVKIYWRDDLSYIDIIGAECITEDGELFVDLDFK